MTKIKICGIKSTEQVDVLNKCLPDYIGFIFAKSKRQVDKVLAQAIKNSLSTKIKTVGVFMNQEIDFIVDIAKSNIIDIIQLHGEEDNRYILDLKNKISMPIIKAIKVCDSINKDEINNYKNIVNYFLFDTFSVQGGGSGKTFDWSVLQDIDVQYFLAGGLNIDNVCIAKSMLSPYALDISSGVETENEKDNKKIQEIILKLRSLEE